VNRSNNLHTTSSRLPLIRSLADIGRNHSSSKSEYEHNETSSIVASINARLKEGHELNSYNNYINIDCNDVYI
jgi:hypothetical protein